MRLAGLLAAALVLAAPAMAQQVAVRTVVEADGSRTLIHEAVIAAPQAVVWQAIATPAGWKTWAVPVAWTPPGELDAIETSYNPAARPGGADTIKQRVVARIPGRMLAYRTVKAPVGFPHADSYAKVLSVFELEPAGKGTNVRLTGVGYTNDAAGRALLGFFEQGNKVALEMLRTRFRDGPVDWSRKFGGAVKPR